MAGFSNKSTTKQKSVRGRIHGPSAMATAATMPGFQVRSTGFLRPETVEQPTNRQQRRAKAAKEREQ